MRVLVDTSVWSLALRRQAKDLSSEDRRIRDELAELVREGRAELMGVVRQELLSGIKSEAQFECLRQELRAFPDPQLEADDYELAARSSNACRAAGLAGSAIDFLICAVALRQNWPIFTVDTDFSRYARHLSLRLHSPRTNRPTKRN